MKSEILKLIAILAMVAGILYGAVNCYNTASIAINEKNSQLETVYNW